MDEGNETEEWVIVEYNNNNNNNNNNKYNNFRDIDDDEERMRSELGWTLETWLSLGKNAVMTGVIISSIPILVPPLVVIAALGCAFSLPLGFVFATYACTNKLVTKLLPAPATSPPHPEGEEEKQMEAAVKGDVETRIELADDTDNDFDRETRDEAPFGSVGPGPATINAEITDLYAAAEAEDVKFAENEEKASQAVETDTVADNEKADREDEHGSEHGILMNDDVVNVDSSLAEEHEVIVDDEEHEMGGLGQSVDKSKTSTGESYDPAKTVADDGELKHDNDQIAVDGGALEHEVLVETNDKSETSTVDVVFSEIAVDVFTNDEGVVDKKIEVRSVTIYSEPADGNQAEAKTVADDEVKEEIKDTHVVGDDARSVEGLLGEDEEIQKKMEGIRAIVGYKGPKGNSCMEELKALYVFVGIEPPPDSDDFQNQLRFLMSVIGLK